MTLLLPSHFHLHLTTFSLFFYSHTYSIRPQVCFSSDSFVCLLFFPCVCSLFTYHIHKLHTIVSDGLCTHKDPLPDTDYVLLLLYLNEIIATLALSSCSVVKKGKKKTTQEILSAPTPLWLNTLTLSFSHSLVASASFSPSRLTTSDLSTPTALPTMKGGRGVARDEEEGR